MVPSFSMRFRRMVFRLLCPFILLLVATGVPTLCASAQTQDVAVEGYITFIHFPAGFDVNGRHVATFAGTSYRDPNDEWIECKMNAADNSLCPAMKIGVYVQVVGAKDRLNKTIFPVIAKDVVILHDANPALAGFGVIDKVISGGPEPVFQADGYRIQITSATKIDFSEGLKTLADVGANTWVHYKGKRDPTGLLVASKVEFFPAKKAKVNAVPGLEVSDLKFQPPRSSIQSSASQSSAPLPKDASDQGDIRTQAGKVKLAPVGGWHRIPADPALQDRVRRIGMRVIPRYQNELPETDPSKINFRFYAVDAEKIHYVICSIDGLILVPLQMAVRLKDDDKLAAVLADGVAFNLQRQAARIIVANRVALGTEIAGEIGGAFVPGLGLVASIGDMTAANMTDPIVMEKQRARVVLSLLADAGYDPWQAPEAWRLLGPKHLPSNLDALSYPILPSGYQLAILNLQYKTASAAVTPDPVP